MSGFMKTTLVCALLCLCVLGGLTSCGNLPDLPGTQIVRVDDRDLEILVRRHEKAAYTLVFESGARNCIQRWEKVLQELPDDVNVFAYNRPGYCKSSPSTTARNSANIVNELRGALKQQGLQPPYVLIGHSIGGLYVQQFARQYPEEVKGLVLVDAMYPGFMKTPEEFPWYTKMGMYLFLSSTVRGEIKLAYVNGVMIDELPPIDDMPIVRMFNEPKGAEGTAIAVDLGMFNRDEASFNKIKTMYPRAKVVVADSSHQMQDSSPDLVVEAIRDVMRAQGPFQ
jgi:pimeloyl-ACP methyl ester carboxylesterase